MSENMNCLFCGNAQCELIELPGADDRPRVQVHCGKCGAGGPIVVIKTDMPAAIAEAWKWWNMPRHGMRGIKIEGRIN